MIDKKRIESAVREILYAIGENPERDGLIETPSRVADMYVEIFAGLHVNPKECTKVFYEPDSSDLVVVKDIPFQSVCEHHLIPFIGKACIAYKPDGGRILGLSKVARLVDVLSRRPQVQERITSQLADIIMEFVNPRGVYVYVEAEHLCMTMRGVKKPGAKTVTTCTRGDIDEKDISAVLGGTHG
ncbi:MAG: GTP cyclohydrolase I FolE [Candidatus Bathyarchaeota archaeon]|nr:GTP cyclohydrolase I FolE [Candidatus Termiticorpusculum sp.]MCL1970842.1 GTP cyclohydrolase I FolE [Candidatus Termiticorpusculum sp.]